MNEKAVVSLEQELNETVKQLVAEARLYANYAGRKKVIKMSDVSLARTRGRGLTRKYMPMVKRRKIPSKLLQRNRLVHAVATYPSVSQ